MKIMSFKDFVHKNGLKNKATSNKLFYQVVTSIGFNNVEKYLRDEPFSSDVGIDFLHQSIRTHWVASINEKNFDLYGCSPPRKLLL